MTARDNFKNKNKISICLDCSKKIFYNNMKHECIKYEPCSMPEVPEKSYEKFLCPAKHKRNIKKLNKR